MAQWIPYLVIIITVVVGAWMYTQRASIPENYKIYTIAILSVIVGLAIVVIYIDMTAKRERDAESTKERIFLVDHVHSWDVKTEGFKSFKVQFGRSKATLSLEGRNPKNAYLNGVEISIFPYGSGHRVVCRKKQSSNLRGWFYLM